MNFVADNRRIFMTGTRDTYSICCRSFTPPLWLFNNQDNIKSLMVDIIDGNSYHCLKGNMSYVKNGMYKCFGKLRNYVRFMAEKYIPLTGAHTK